MPGEVEAPAEATGPTITRQVRSKPRVNLKYIQLNLLPFPRATLTRV